MTDRPRTKLTCPQHPKHRADDCALCAAAKDGRAAADRAISRAGLTDRPREWQIEVCTECGFDPEWCVCDECDEIKTIPAVEVLGPKAMLAWALRNAGRGRVVPIIERTLMDHERSTDYRLTAEDVFDAIKEASDGAE